MTINTTLFAQILPMFTGQTERAATEALRHILARSEPARGALEDMLLSAGAEVGSFTRFRTEVTGDDGERVDLVCYDGDGTERVLVETKFWAALTDNQPNTYLARLPEEGHSVLLFVAPAQRMESLWLQLRERAQTNHNLTILPEPGELHNAAVNGEQRKLMAISWRALLNLMLSRTTSAGDLAAVKDIEQLLGLTERMDSEAFLPIHSDELSQGFPRRMRNLIDLVEDAVQQAIYIGLANIDNLNISPRRYGFGRNLRLDDEEAWFGINVENWARLGKTPLWLQFRQDIPSDSWYPICLPTGVEYANVLESVVKHLDDIAQQRVQGHNDNV